MVYEILLVGEEHAQTGRELCSILKITARELTAAIERERKAGKPICANTSTNQGYYIAPDKEAMESYCKSLQRREKSIAETRKACRKTIEQLPAREAQ